MRQMTFEEFKRQYVDYRINTGLRDSLLIAYGMMHGYSLAVNVLSDDCEKAKRCRDEIYDKFMRIKNDHTK